VYLVGGLASQFALTLFLGLLLNKPSLNMAHALLLCANVSDGPPIELLEMLGDDEEHVRNIKHTLIMNHT